MPYSPRHVTWRGTAQLNGRQLKHYDVTACDAEIEPGVRKAAHDILPRLLPAPDATTPPASFVILHRGAATGAYLVAYSWFWDNVIGVQKAVAGVGELGCPDDNPENFIELTDPGIGCVWELGPLAHERAAWIRHVLAPDEPDLAAYLTDVYPARMTD
jgi:hypothetical protein